MPTRKSPTRTRRAPTTRAGAKTTTPPKPTPGPGERAFFLDVPFEERAVPRVFGATWYPGLGHVYVGADLPQELRRYRPKAYSWEQWGEDTYAGAISETSPAPAPTADTGTFTLRPDQLEDVRTMLVARKAGAPEVLNASNVGTGKTAVTIAAVNRMSRVKNVLVICPLSVTPGWRTHLKEMGDGGKNWCVINYESVKKLLEPPAKAHTAKRTRTKNLHTVREGTPKVQWDVVITDEAQHRANPESQQSRAINRIIAGPGQRSAFTIGLSATPGSKPSELSYLYRGLLWREGHQAPPDISIESFVRWCQAHGFSVDRSGYGNALNWSAEGADADRELTRMNGLLYGGQVPWALRRTPNWPTQQRLLVPVELTADQMAAYNVEWAQFQSAMRTISTQSTAQAGGGRSAAQAAKMRTSAQAHGRAAQVRFRQKAGQVRAQGTAEFIAEKVAAGFQVSVSAEYIGTVERLTDALGAKGIRVGTFTGQNRDTREDERLAYQRGEHQVLIYTPTEGFNLHAGETSVGGNSTPRLTVVAEPRWSPKKALQAEGRAQRNGTSAPVFYMYAVGTVEDKVLRTVIRGMRNTAVINGDDTTPMNELADALGVPHLIA